MTKTMIDSGVTYLKQIPSNWNIYRIKDGFTCNKEIVGDNWINTQLLSLTTNGVKEKDIENPNGKLPESFDTYQLVNKNNVIMCLFDLDCSAVFSGLSNYNGMISPAYKVLTCKPDIIEPRYAGYYFNFISFDRKYMHYSKNIRYTLNYDEFSSLPMLYPPLQEQIKIADYLDMKCNIIDMVINNNLKSIDLLNEYQKSIITEEILNDSDYYDSDGFFIKRIPRDYKLVIFRYLLEGKVDNRGRTPELIDDDNQIPLVEVNAIGNKNPDLTQVKKYINKESHDIYIRKDLEPGDIIFTTVGATIGKCSIVGKDANYCIAQNLVAYRFKNSQYPLYWYYYFKSGIFNYTYKQYNKGNTIDNVKISNLDGAKMIVPPYNKQVVIASKLESKIDKINKIINIRLEMNKKLEDYKRSLIYEVVTGKKEV